MLHELAHMYTSDKRVGPTAQELWDQLRQEYMGTRGLPGNGCFSDLPAPVSAAGTSTARPHSCAGGQALRASGHAISTARQSLGSAEWVLMNPEMLPTTPSRRSSSTRPQTAAMNAHRSRPPSSYGPPPRTERGRCRARCDQTIHALQQVSLGPPSARTSGSQPPSYTTTSNHLPTSAQRSRACEGSTPSYQGPSPNCRSRESTRGSAVFPHQSRSGSHPPHVSTCNGFSTRRAQSVGSRRSKRPVSLQSMALPSQLVESVPTISERAGPGQSVTGRASDRSVGTNPPRHDEMIMVRTRTEGFAPEYALPERVVLERPRHGQTTAACRGDGTMVGRSAAYDQPPELDLAQVVIGQQVQATTATSSTVVNVSQLVATSNGSVMGMSMSMGSDGIVMSSVGGTARRLRRVTGRVSRG